jgi:UDP-N-acetylglucosamine diphosphorylase/glucosamine-1-phosphate N-acetyltransferase
MRLCVFEDDRVWQLDSLVLVRPAFDLCCGAGSLLERHCRHFGATEVGFIVRPSLAGWCRFIHPCHTVNDAAWLGAGAIVLVNARWLAPVDPVTINLEAPLVGLVSNQVAYAVVPVPACPEAELQQLLGWIESWRQSVPHTQAGGVMIDFPWNLVRHNAESLTEDVNRYRAGSTELDSNNSPILHGPGERLFIHPGAFLETPVVVDTRNGPVIIDRGAVVSAFSRLEGPCYIGPGSQILGARIKASTIGPECRVGGEVEASILQGYVNKYHDGFLGHSYVGEWVNLAAGTQVSDLRNDYGNIRITVAGEEMDTGLVKVGAFIGDHARTGVGTLLNCGTVAGVFVQLLPSGFHLPRTVPSFCTVWQGQIQKRTSFSQLFTGAATAMHRRGQEWKAEHAEFFLGVYEATAEERSAAVTQESANGHAMTPPSRRPRPRRCF